MSNQYVSQLSESTQKSIHSALSTSLQNEGLSGIELNEAIQNGIQSRISDLSDTIQHIILHLTPIT